MELPPISSQLYQRLIDCLHQDIQNLYDDPFSGSGAETFEEIREEIKLLQEFAAALQQDYQAIVQKEATEFEQTRMEIILGSQTHHELWTKLDQLDAEARAKEPNWTEEN